MKTSAEALENLEKDHNKKAIFIFVQFKGLEFDKIPRIYMVSVQEVVQFLSTTRGGHINLILNEKHKYARNWRRS